MELRSCSVSPTEDSQTTIAVAAKNVGLSVSHKDFDTPKVVALGIEITAGPDEIAIRALERAQTAVVRGYMKKGSVVKGQVSCVIRYAGVNFQSMV